MAEYKCPKCGGSDYFMSQRNVVKGMGWAQRGSIKSIPVCRVCDEIMQGAQIGSLSWETFTGKDGKGPMPSNAISRRTKILYFLSPFPIFAVYFNPQLNSNIYFALLILFAVLKKKFSYLF